MEDWNNQAQLTHWTGVKSMSQKAVYENRILLPYFHELLLLYHLKARAQLIVE